MRAETAREHRISPESPANFLTTPEYWSKFLDTDAHIVPSREEILSLSTDKFLGHINKLAAEVTTSQDYHDKETGYISDNAWQRLVDGGMLSTFLNERNPAGKQEELMQLGRILSYYDLHLGLAYGIVGALGVVPIQKYGSENQQKEILDIVRNGEKIGLAITEPTKSGTAAFSMDSTYEIQEGSVTVKFSKHLQGHSGEAGLIVAAPKKDTAKLTVGLIFVPQEHIDTKLTQTHGLAGIRYGVNSGEITLDKEKYLLVEFTSNRMREFQDMFIKSRLFFVGMTLGHQERMELEANNYAAQREIGDIMQNELLVVRRTLNQMKARRMATEAMLSAILDLDVVEDDTTGLVAQANIMKNLSTEYAVLSAQDRAVLAGGGAYYPGGPLQNYIDMWPFQIFEGPEPFLNTQAGDLLLRRFEISDGVFVPSFSDTKAYSNFIEFVEKSISKRELFNDTSIVGGLDDETKAELTKIKPGKMSDDLKERMGLIISRLYALGNLDKVELTQEELKEVRSMLNYEIRNEVDEFTRRRENPLVST